MLEKLNEIRTRLTELLASDDNLDEKALEELRDPIS
jgi:hypothetical protein